MLIGQIFELDLRRPGPPGRRCTPTTGYFHDKTKISQENLSVAGAYSPCMQGMHCIRGGVEDTRLEAKAKDTKKSEAKAKDSLSEDRHSRGQGQECSRPRTKDTKRKCSPKKKKKVFTKIFQAISTKKRFPKNFSSAPQNFNIPKNRAVLEPKTGQFSRT